MGSTIRALRSQRFQSAMSELRVDLFECSRCHLRFVWENEIPNECPRCRRHSQIPPAIIVGGFNVLVNTLRTYGVEKGLFDAAVRRGLHKVPLGDRCKHGRLTYLLCSSCLH